MRYYEKIKLIKPKRKIENSYREFNSHEILQFMAFDFYKKRGFNLLEIKNRMKQSNHADISNTLEQKTIELQQNIYKQQCILKRLNKTKEFYKYVRTMDGNFEIRDFPLFSVLKSFDDVGDISNYGDTILRTLDGEDILSHLVRAVSLDATSYKGSKICIVKKVTGKFHGIREQFLETGKCMYTAGIMGDFFSEKMFFAAHKWANEHSVKHKGIAYYFIRFVLLGKNKIQQFYELWIPIK